VRHADVVVIGAGAMGSAAAWHLARRGCDVVLAEQFGPGHRNGSSHGGVRIFRHAYSDPHYVGLAARALPLWRQLESDAGETLLDLTGAYDHGPRAAIDAIADALDSHRVAYERMTPDAAQERVAGLRFDDTVLHHALAGRCFADRTVAALQRRTADLGGDVRFDAPAALRVVGDHVEVDVAGEIVVADAAIVTAGAWVAPLLGAAGLEAPHVRITQEQVLHFAPLDPAAAWPSFIHHRMPWRYGLHTPGEGLKVGGHHEGAVISADERTYDLDDDKLRSIVEYVETWVPGVDPAPRFGATCLYTTTANEDFVLDRVGPVVIGSPCSGHGFKFTPLIGELLADLALGADVDATIDPRHRLARFT
jgi:sarcosine oxidase